MKAIVLSLLISTVFMVMLGGGCSVSGNQANFADYPQHVQFGAAPNQRVYLQKPGYYAVHYAQPEDVVAAGATAVMEEEAIAIFPGAPPANAPARAIISPVYTLQSGSSLAIPTGRIFVRLTETVSVEARQAELQAAGFEIVEQPPYAPHAAWVQSRSGSIADALQHLSELAAIPNMENVEPQMLMQRSLR